MPDADEFAQFVAARSPLLLRSAWLLTGTRTAAEDLVQAALERTWTRWPSVRDDDPVGYVRKVMLTTYLSWRRRRSWSELPVAEPPDRVVPTADPDLPQSVAAALADLSRGQRAVVVLRYFDDLTEAQTAATLGCSLGTVKSQAARALTRLRSHPALTGLWTDEELPR